MMNFGNIGRMGGAVASYISTPEGQEIVKKFLSSPDGVALLKNFASTSEGQKVIAGILPQLLGSLNLPPGVADMITGALASRV
ncbi:MAG: hypothetical protein NTZ39_10140 [Methanoregula sp.]|nr:hypothetical protein [Methanoregula sp.]